MIQFEICPGGVTVEVRRGPPVAEIERGMIGSPAGKSQCWLGRNGNYCRSTPETASADTTPVGQLKGNLLG